MPLIFLAVSACMGVDPDRPEVTIVEPAVATTIPVATAAKPIAAPEELTPSSATAPSTKRDHERQLQKLHVQKALNEARRNLDADDPAAAIATLEQHLDYAGGADDYLDLLDNAYRRRLAALVKADRLDEVKLLEERRKILSTRTPTPPVAATEKPAEKEKQAEKTETPKYAVIGKATGNGIFGQLFGKKSAPKAADKDDLVVRARWDHRNPEANETEKPKASAGAEDLKQAEKLWKERNFVGALRHYDAAYRADPEGAVQDARDRFGYCLLWSAYSKWEPKTADAGKPIDDRCFEEWEADVKQGRQLVRLESFRKFADDQLKLVEERRKLRYRAPVAPEPKPAVVPKTATSVAANVSYRHLPTQEQHRGWRITETENFRIVHRDVALAEEVAVIAENARRQAHDLWFAAEPLAQWTPKCDLVLYPTAAEFAQQTNQMPQSPAFTQCDVHDGWVASRRIELRVDEPNMKTGILPHEIAHAVFAGQFARRSPPKWADEGMAVLTEPEDIQNRHLSGLVTARSQGRGFTCDKLLPMQGYPQQVQEFYAHSVGVCRMLVERHGGRERLVQFVRTAMETNDYEGALFRIYAIRGLKDLETRFQQYVGELRTGGYAAR